MEQTSPEKEAREFIERHRALLATSKSRLQNNPDFDLSRDALRIELAKTLKPLADAKLRLALLRLKWKIWDDYADTTLGRSQVQQWSESPNARAQRADDESQETSAAVDKLEKNEEIEAALVLLEALESEPNQTGTLG